MAMTARATVLLQDHKPDNTAMSAANEDLVGDITGGSFLNQRALTFLLT